MQSIALSSTTGPLLARLSALSMHVISAWPGMKMLKLVSRATKAEVEDTMEYEEK